jgi:peptide alpha-N-acetyltransferase
MAISIRTATMDDMVSIMDTNLRCLPENYGIRYYLFTLLTWPELTKVAVDPTGRVVGYVLAKM